eukprot:CAMPEP_0202728630 /NCGR_PEP_ID=MMETSP1385-20130828/185726_1 /ASSEMBLY_ACC=CAM_ASM_000861 /TAXON_ID=933848 /ORGANISM="Elphidium margaritaceum" /LENGTH=514 /DNA_ID=CAMNT_0049394881 /DNA_START=242 /DNA_END=1786 /DNA_ORIENTATION=+
MTTQTGIVNAYIADALPLKFAVSGFMKLVSIFGAADILAKAIVFAMLTEEVSSYLQFAAVSEIRIMMIAIIGLYVCICLLCLCFLPESLPTDMRTKYRQRNACHGITYTCTKLLFYVSCLTFLCRFAQIGITSLTHDLLLMNTSTIYAGDVAVLYGDVLRNEGQLSITQMLNEEVIIYAVFVLALASTLICAPCYLSCFCCARVLANMLCSMLLMVVSFALLIFILFSTQWYQCIVALVAGSLFGFGEIGFAFLYGAMTKYIKSKQYGIAYGVIATAYNASTAGAPYAFYLLYAFTRDGSIPEAYMSYFGDAKFVVYMAVFITCLALLCYYPVNSSMHAYVEDRRPQQQDRAKQHARLSMHTDFQGDAAMSSELQEGVEMAPAPRAMVHMQAVQHVQMVQSPHSSMQVHASEPVEVAESVTSRQYVVGQSAPQYQQRPYIAAESAHEPNWSWMQQQQPHAHAYGVTVSSANQYPSSPVFEIQHNASPLNQYPISYASPNSQMQAPYFFANANAV